jgi:hypothetical protein
MPMPNVVPWDEQYHATLATYLLNHGILCRGSISNDRYYDYIGLFNTVHNCFDLRRDSLWLEKFYVGLKMTPSLIVASKSPNIQAEVDTFVQRENVDFLTVDLARRMLRKGSRATRADREQILSVMDSVSCGAWMGIAAAVIVISGEHYDFSKTFKMFVGEV